MDINDKSQIAEDIFKEIFQEMIDGYNEYNEVKKVIMKPYIKKIESAMLEIAKNVDFIESQALEQIKQYDKQLDIKMQQAEEKYREVGHTQKAYENLSYMYNGTLEELEKYKEENKALQQKLDYVECKNRELILTSNNAIKNIPEQLINEEEFEDVIKFGSPSSTVELQRDLIIVQAKYEQLDKIFYESKSEHREEIEKMRLLLEYKDNLLNELGKEKDTLSKQVRELSKIEKAYRLLTRD